MEPTWTQRTRAGNVSSQAHGPALHLSRTQMARVSLSCASEVSKYLHQSTSVRFQGSPLAQVTPASPLEAPASSHQLTSLLGATLSQGRAMVFKLGL